MSAKVVQEGFSMAGFDDAGKFTQSDVAIIRGEVPGPHGEWMFVVIEDKFCWIHGLPAGQGYMKYEIPLTGSQSTWNAQIEKIVAEGPKETLPSISVEVGSKTALAQPDFYIISE